jgi:hypothetical protein
VTRATNSADIIDGNGVFYLSHGMAKVPRSYRLQLCNWWL